MFRKTGSPFQGIFHNIGTGLKQHEPTGDTIEKGEYCFPGRVKVGNSGDKRCSFFVL
jgi:hypothetical protein